MLSDVNDLLIGMAVITTALYFWVLYKALAQSTEEKKDIVNRIRGEN